MSLSLFDLSNEFFALKDLLENDCEYNEETGEITDNSELLKELFENLKLSFEEKLDNSQRYVLTLNGEADILAKEIKRLQARKQALENKADRLTEMMKNSILSSGQTKFKTSLYNFNIKKTESVEVRDLDLIPRAYLRLKKEADKVAIKKALKDTTPKVGFVYKNKSDEEIYTLTEIENDKFILGAKNISNEKILTLDELQNDLILVSGFSIDGVFLTEKASLGVR